MRVGDAAGHVHRSHHRSRLPKARARRSPRSSATSASSPTWRRTIAGSPVALQGFVALQTALRGSPADGARARGRRHHRQPLQRARRTRSPRTRRSRPARAARRTSSPRCAPASRSRTSGSRRSARSPKRCSIARRRPRRPRRRGGARGHHPDRLHDAREPRGQRGRDADRRRVRRARLPAGLDAVVVEPPICRDNGQPLQVRLSYEQAVERVPVVKGQFVDMPCVGRTDR